LLTACHARASSTPIFVAVTNRGDSVALDGVDAVFGPLIEAYSK